jgi:predicted amidophosphoribosyltransferase
MNTELIELFGQTELITWIEQKETHGLSLCQACAAHMRERDKFCRHCGTRQTEHVSDLVYGEVKLPSTYVTSRLSRPVYYNFSGLLMNNIATCAAISKSRINNRMAKCAISALIALPLWLTIVLLSPLDAYSMAKAIANQH